MTQPATDASVRTSITVQVPPERAWSVFCERMGAWWSRDYSIGRAELADAVVEPRAGGRWYEVGADGSECDWGRVIAWEPPARLVLAWQIGVDWSHDPDPGRASEVEVRFVPEGAGATRVELEHRRLERHGEGWEGLKGGVEADEGWPLYLDRYAALLGG